jgi:lipoyl(octanoyl) transferase
MNIIINDLGILNYKEAWDYQEKILAEIVTAKEHEQPIHNTFILCEHPHVYTLGKSGQKNNLLINEQFLNKIGATYYEINRGGDITYHGPGQLVGYPIFDLESFHIGPREYIYRIEETIIRTLEHYNLRASRMKDATGVWLDVGRHSVRKLCAIGVRISKGVTMHGFALNVNTDLNYFTHINPCGFQDKGVTSVQKELGAPQSMKNLKNILVKQFATVFEVPVGSLTIEPNG